MGWREMGGPGHPLPPLPPLEGALEWGEGGWANVALRNPIPHPTARERLRRDLDPGPMGGAAALDPWEGSTRAFPNHPLGWEV